jgi:hypothetical protein
MSSSALGLVAPTLGEPRPDVHARRVVPEEERLLLRVRTVDEIERAGEEIILNSLHPLSRQRAWIPFGAPGIPTVVSPVRIGICPVIKAARPAVQLACA